MSSGHKWADLSEGDYGVSLITDCKYGYDVFGSVMRISLLRAPNCPDRTADSVSTDSNTPTIPTNTLGSSAAQYRRYYL